jgi:hypothetical protein
MECPYTGSNKAKIQACECKDQIDKLARSIKLYEDTIRDNSVKNSNYQTAYNNWSVDKKNWDTTRQEKKTALENETKIWRNCVLWTGVFGHDDWCQGDTQFGRQTGANGHGCLNGQGKGECKRTTDQVNSALDQWVNQNNAPQEPGKPQLQTPQAPSASITCCGISFDNITGSSVSIDNISQKCGSSSTDSPSKESASKLSSSNDSNSIDKKYIITGVFVFLLISSISILLLMSQSD